MRITQFQDLNELQEHFRLGDVNFSSERIEIAGLPYKFRQASKHPMDEMIAHNKAGAIIYTTGRDRQDEARSRGLDAWVVFIWRPVDQRLMPVAVETISSGRRFMYEQADNVIGDIVDVKFANLPSTNTLKGRVDTGATVSSLHADQLKVDGDTVRFVCNPLSPNVFTMKVANQQLVKSPDGGQEYRPVVALNVGINGKMIPEQLFNLNDRSQMDHPVLIGQNVLEKGGFLVNPSIQEEIDMDAVLEQFAEKEYDIEEPNPEKEEDVKQLLAHLRESNLTFADLMRVMQTEAMEVMEDIEY